MSALVPDLAPVSPAYSVPVGSEDAKISEPGRLVSISTSRPTNAVERPSSPW